jgi:peptidoglycan/LPS O-acetylase OafA/YrhL
MKRVPSLDGLRAVSICLVLLSHVLLHAEPRGILETNALWIVGNGETGVCAFFVLSGFLITILLLKEKEASGRIRLSAFYLRRIFRILPAFLLYICVVAVLVKIGMISVPRWQFLRALTFTMDYVNPKSWWVGHTWSLSVQEQFYFAWPIVVIFCSRKTLTWIAAGIIVLEPFIRVADRVLAPWRKDEIFYMLHTRADMLMFGCLVALLFEKPRFIEFVEGLFQKRAPAIAAIFLFLISPLIVMNVRGSYFLTIGYTLQGICISLLLLYAIRRADSRLGRFLNAPSVVWVGLLSYSIYIWQELFIGFDTFSTKRSAIGLIFLVPTAIASYYLVEKPMLKLKDHFEKRRTPIKTLPTGTQAAQAKFSS